MHFLNSSVSPFIKTFSLAATNKIFHLFEMFSTPKFLLATPYNHNLTQMLLEVCSTLTDRYACIHAIAFCCLGAE